MGIASGGRGYPGTNGHDNSTAGKRRHYTAFAGTPTCNMLFARRPAPSLFDKKRQQEDLFVSGLSGIGSMPTDFDAVTFFAVIKEGLK
ncbi:hypothetical protein GCM10007426_27940 [Alloalcanivorax dieselolei]|nr:hypothetical protein GCM10007426_27940 [Alloalcanivorax dieselolei]